MDELLWYLLLGVVYLVFQVLGARKKKQPRPVPPPQPTSAPDGRPTHEPTLDDALREIRVALGMEPPAPPPLPPVESPPRELIDTAAPPAWGSEFVPHQKHFSDDEFEALRRGADGFQDPHFERSATLPPPPMPRQTPPAVPPHRIRQTLRTPEKAREAFVLGEVFGPPRALRRRR